MSLPVYQLHKIHFRGVRMLHKQIRSEHGTVHYWISRSENADKTLVFSHGLCANHTMFEKQVLFFQKNFNIILWDIPLHGLSRPYQNFSYENCAKELYSVLKIEQIDKAILIGMSMGGYPAQMFANRYPQKTEALIALDTSPFGPDYYSRSDIWWLKRVGRIAKCIPDKLLRNLCAKSVAKSPYSYEIMMNMLQPLSKFEIIEQMDIAYRGFIKENRDVSFHCPVLILLGQYDTTGKVKTYCEKWSKKTSYPLIMIKDAAHFSNGDNPDQVNHEILQFIQKVIDISE